jgi:hypothetical protein
MAEANGRDLRKVTSLDGSPLILRAFSAGGSAIKRYLDNDDSRALVTAVTLSDGTYETEPGMVAPGFLKFALEAVDGSKLFVATASGFGNVTGGPRAMTGEQTLATLRTAVEQASGKKFEPVSVPGVGEGYRLGGNFFFELGTKWQHAQHATELGPIVWTQLVEPFLARSGLFSLRSRVPEIAKAGVLGSVHSTYKKAVSSHKSLLPGILLTLGAGGVLFYVISKLASSSSYMLSDVGEYKSSGGVCNASGWLLPSGEFIPADDESHLDIVERMLPEEPGSGASKALDQGWIRISRGNVEMFYATRDNLLLLARTFPECIFPVVDITSRSWLPCYYDVPSGVLAEGKPGLLRDYIG